MNLADIKDCLNTHTLSEKGMVCKISKILEACEQSKNLMIGIYLIEKRQFLYCNRILKNILGENRSQLLNGGWDFWFSRINKSETQNVKEKLLTFLKTPFKNNSLTLDYQILNFKNKHISIKHELLLYKIKDQTLVLNYLFDISDRKRIEECLTPPNHDYSNGKNTRVSVREKEVLSLIANGFSSKEIADILFISNHTAISHRKNLIEKFKVKNTAHLIKKAGTYIDL